MKKADKPIFVENLSEKLVSATGYVLVDFNGLTVKLQQDLKKRLREVDATMEVVKNSLFKLAAGKAKSPTEIATDTVLQGPTAIVITKSDPISILQVISKFAKESEMPQLKVGVIENSFQDKTSLEKLATLPGKQVLQMQVIGAIQAPTYGLVGTLQGNIQKLLYMLDQKAKSN